MRPKLLILASAVAFITATLAMTASAVGKQSASIVGGWRGLESTEQPAPAPASAPAITTARTISTVWHNTVFRLSDEGKEGPSVGDSYVFGGPLFDSDDTERVGFLSGECTYTNPKFHALATCAVTATPHEEGPSLAQGDQITLQGWNDDVPVESFKQAITGGTGIYQNVRGEMVARGGNPLRIIFRLEP